MEKLKTIEDKVRSILEVSMIARNDDRLLIATYMRGFHNIHTFNEYYAQKEAPSVESIRRVRQKIQANGECLSDRQVKEARANLEPTYEEYSRS